MDLRHVLAPSRDSLTYLIYLYLWPFWMFRDARAGNLFERAAAYRHNRALRIHLPGYLIKWSLIFALLLAATWWLEQQAAAYWSWQACCQVLAGATGTMAALAVVVFVVTLVAYLFLCRWES